MTAQSFQFLFASKKEKPGLRKEVSDLYANLLMLQKLSPRCLIGLETLQ